MLDLELLVPPTDVSVDIVSIEAMRRHMRFRRSTHDELLRECLDDAVSRLDGLYGVLNRTIFPRTWIRHMPAFPACGVIKLPLPPLISVLGITYDDGSGSSPGAELPASHYIVRERALIGEVVLKDGYRWPYTARSPRAVSVTYRAGYTTYPAVLKRYVKVLAAHYFNFPEAALIETRHTVNRKIEFGIDDLQAQLRVPVSYDDWE